MIDAWEFRGMRPQLDDFKLGQQYATVAHNIWLYSGSLDPLCKPQVWRDNCDFSNTRTVYRHEQHILTSDRDYDFAQSVSRRDVFERIYFVDNGCLQFVEGDRIEGDVCGFPEGAGQVYTAGVIPPPVVDYAFLAGPYPWNPNLYDAIQAGENIPQHGMLLGNVDYVPPDNDDPFQNSNYETSFVFTYVNRWGEESAPSFPSEFMPYNDGDTITLQALARSKDFNVIGIRVYMSIDGDFYRISNPDVTHNEGGRYEVPNLTVDYSATNPFVTLPNGDNLDFIRFTIDRQSALDQLITEDWVPPPCNLPLLERDRQTNFVHDQPINHMEELHNGMIVLADKHSLYFNEPYTGHAFPDRYTIEINDVILAVHRIDGGFVVLTDSYPRIFLGSTPATLQEVEHYFNHAISDPEGACRVDSGIAYPCEEGIAFISASQARILNDGIIDRKTWQTIVTPSNCQLNIYEGRIIILTELPQEGRERLPDEYTHQNVGYVYNINQGELTSFDADNLSMAFGLWRDPRFNDIIMRQGDQLVSFHMGDPMDYVWRSGKMPIAHGYNLSSTRVEAESYPLTINFIDGGSVKEHVNPKVIRDNMPTRTVGTNRSRWVQYEVRHDARVSNIQWAMDFNQLR